MDVLELIKYLKQHSKHLYIDYHAVTPHSIVIYFLSEFAGVNASVTVSFDIKKVESKDYKYIDAMLQNVCKSIGYKTYNVNDKQ